MARFQVHYGEIHFSKRSYVVWDSIANRIVYESDAKSSCIVESQRRNRFPIDGSEQSYALQVKEAK